MLEGARWTRWDAPVGALLFIASALWVAALPKDLGISDEGTFLYTSKMLSQGRVLYRDVFEIVAPGFFYLMAGVFRVFGASMEAARATNAVMHGGIVLLIYLVARLLLVRSVVAAPVALIHIAALQPAWPEASPHWLCTLLTLVLLAVVLRRPRYWPALSGVVVGLVISVQHQKGVIIAASMGVLLLWDALRPQDDSTSAPPGRRLVASLGWLVAGIVAVVGPLAAVVITRAGVEPVFGALVRQPLVNYRTYNRTSWASVHFMTKSLAQYTYPRVLRYAPALIPITLLLAAIGRGDVPRQCRNAVIAAAFATVSAGSVWYYPDFVHVAFIAPSFLILLAWIIERLLRRAPRPLGQVSGALCAAGMLIGIAVQLHTTRVMRYAEFPIIASTAFGTVAFRDEHGVALTRRVQELADESGSLRQVFLYPVYASLYLTAGIENPTPYQLLLPIYSPPDQFDEVLAALDATQVKYIGVLRPFVKPDDPIWVYVSAKYEPVPSELDWKLGLFFYRRLPDAPALP